MNIHIFNGCLLGGWFLLTLGGILMNPAAGLITGGVALVALTLLIALRYGIYDGRPKKEDKANSGEAG